MEDCPVKTFILLLTLAAAAAGCGGTGLDPGLDPTRLANGLVIVLPGIEGGEGLSGGIRDGLLSGGVTAAVPIVQWGRPVPVAGPLLNQMDFVGNRLVAQRLAQMVANYQDAHPGQPVYLVGHSGGGGVAVFTAEALGELGAERKVEGLVLLSASISKGYDLAKALAQCRKGIVNFYSRGDLAVLGVGTTVFGNVDGVRGPAAGAVGFDNSYARLYQVPWSEDMLSYGNLGGHIDTANERFVRQYVARWVTGPAWPAR